MSVTRTTKGVAFEVLVCAPAPAPSASAATAPISTVAAPILRTVTSCSPPLVFATVKRKLSAESTSETPRHAALAVVLQVRDGVLQVLLWQRARDPFAGRWALPGGYLEAGETLETSIRRHLAAKVDVRELSHLEQLETLSDPDRVPQEWQLATAYLGLVPSDLDPAVPGDTAWHPVDRLPPMAFD